MPCGNVFLIVFDGTEKRIYPSRIFQGGAMPLWRPVRQRLCKSGGNAIEDILHHAGVTAYLPGKFSNAFSLI